MRFIKYLPIFLGLMFATNSCVVESTDRVGGYHNLDQDLEKYLMGGRWYPISRQGLTECEFNSYYYFENSFGYYYDCFENYDRGSYFVNEGYLYIRYDKYQTDRFEVTRWAKDMLTLVDDEGRQYFYERQL